MKRLDGKVALVTGAGHGIGEGIARMFAAEGASALLADRDAEAVERVAAALRAEGGAAQACIADVAVTPDVQRMVGAAMERFGGLDILVNNAALTGFGRAIDSDDMEARYDLLMATNVKSVWMALHFAVPHLRKQRGSVINIASVQGLASGSENSAYAASKGALIAGTRALAVELAPSHIRVNCISPGMIWKEPPGERLCRDIGEALYAEFEERFPNWHDEGRALVHPWPTPGTPEDIAHCAVYLASDESRFVTGANFVIDGGATALLPNPGHLSPAAEKRRQREPEVRAWIEDARRRHAEENL